MKEPPDYLPDQSKEAIHAAKNAAQAVEIARQEQLESAIKFNDERMVKVITDSLRQVFDKDPGNTDPQMKILIQRVPILCSNILQMHDDITSIQANITWAVRIVLGAVFAALLGMIFIK